MSLLGRELHGPQGHGQVPTGFRRSLWLLESFPNMELRFTLKDSSGWTALATKLTEHLFPGCFFLRRDFACLVRIEA